MRRKANRTPWARRRWRSLLCLGLVVALLMPALVWRVSIRAALNEGLAELVAAGLPVVPEELGEWHSRGFEGDSDDALHAIFEHYSEMELEKLEQLPKFENGSPRLLEVPYSPSTRGALEARVAGNDVMLEHLLDAAALSRIQLVQTFDQGSPQDAWSLRLPFEVLCASACLQAEGGDGVGALERLHKGLEVARACRRVPGTGLLNNVIGYEFMIAAALNSVALRAPLPDEGVDGIEALIRDDDWLADLTYAANGDRCMQLYYNDYVGDGWDRLYAVIGLIDRRKILVLEYYDAYPQLALMSARARVRYVEERGMVYDYSMCRVPLSRTYSPVPLALCRYYQTEGGFPASLDELELGDGEAGEVAYEREESGFSLDGEDWVLEG